jgi:hypothetical protein
MAELELEASANQALRTFFSGNLHEIEATARRSRISSVSNFERRMTALKF